MLNPIIYSEKIVADFLKYQLTTYPFADTKLHEQMRALLNLEEARATPLLRGPYVSLSRSFRRGASLADLVREGLLHPHLQHLAPFPHVYGHQESAIREIAKGHTTLISTGTGSGKTEAFLYPIISHCLKLRDEKVAAGVTAVIVYPMNALAEDQLGRLRQLLVGSGVTFGMYIGKTPGHADDVTGERLPEGASRADYDSTLARLRAQKQHAAVIPPEERPSREEMRTAGKQPRILLTNVKQLELLLTRREDTELFQDSRLDFLVFDEAHTWSGAAGAETACLIRRLRSYCGRQPDESVCVATSATIVDPERGREAGRTFAARFFGVMPEEVAVVGEVYEEDAWPAMRMATGPLPGVPAVQLQTVLDAVGGVEQEPVPSEAIRLLASVFQVMTGSKLDQARWREHLYERLSANEVLYQIADLLKSATPLSDLVIELSARLGRPVPEEEVVAWLALGAVARNDGRPLLRPVMHTFVRGIEGAVVTFPDGKRPRLWLSRREAAEAEESDAGSPQAVQVRLDTMTCTVCGQHYFTHHLEGFEFTGNAPGGGQAVEDRAFWRPQEEKSGGSRVVLVDRLVSEPDDDTDEGDEVGAAAPVAAAAPRNTAVVFLCRRCGALHPAARERCDGCGVPGTLVPLYAVRQDEDQPGKLTKCVSCGAGGRTRVGSYREPARPIRAQPVSDVHVLAQSMVHFAERRRLLVFADNRQDAAFQAGWMQDHARRYRLRSLMFERMTIGPVSIGDLAGHLDDLLERDDDLSRALIPEVWRVERKEVAGVRHATERRRFLRAQVLREVATGPRQRIGLEPWGRMMVAYPQLVPSLSFFNQWAARMGCSPEDLCDGVAALLDNHRRSRVLLDREGSMYSRFWHEGDKEIQRGFFPLIPGGPQGLKLRRSGGDNQSWIKQLVSARGVTGARQAVLKWGLPADQVDAFFEQLWRVLTEETKVLAPVTLTGFRDSVLPGTTGATQIDGDLLLLAANRGLYRCETCRRTCLRRTPRMACIGHHCRGTLSAETESPDDYDLMVLDQRYEMVRPREHSAQIPADERDDLERRFKGQSELVNTIVSTPTLELGVDIGALDAVLMRNVPPRPANYWQRTGRAGRRHRMAVNFTYARPAGHDRSYFADPLKMLRGLVEPPAFNLKNEPMVRKHVHATVLTALHKLASERSALGEPDRAEIVGALELCFPGQIRSYLFDPSENIRARPFEVRPLRTILSKHKEEIVAIVSTVFAQNWPLGDRVVVEPTALARYVDEMADKLAYVISLLEARLRWATDQMSRLEDVRRRKGTLDGDEDALMSRCDRLVKRLKGKNQKRRRDAEGFDDTYTYAVLAAEGFLPGYGLDAGTVAGFHQATRYGVGLRDWEIRRPLPLALREYVPGNLIYANGHRFLPRFFHLEAVQPTLFQFDREIGAVAEIGGGQGDAAAGITSASLLAVPTCDVDLPHQSHITDEEEYRFQLPVAVFGYEQLRHAGGRALAWGNRTVTLRAGLHMRLVNVGTTSSVRTGGALGYPLCRVCGQSRSPFASQADLDKFRQDHRERCGLPVDNVGFFADVIADALTLQSFGDLDEAYSTAEALRKGAAEVLEMEEDDLSILVVGRPGDSQRDAILYDPMPGGSGLLEQVVERWDEVVAAALAVLDGCPSQCGTACTDCLLTYWNQFYQAHLNRETGAGVIRECGGLLAFSHDIPPLMPPHAGSGEPVNDPESTLRFMLERAGFANAVPQHHIDLGRPLATTTPDFFFEDSSGRLEGVCIYLDGMGDGLHGHPARQQRDREIREHLRAQNYEVIEITYGQLHDRAAMALKFRRLGNALLGKDRAREIAESLGWFDEAHESARAATRAPEAPAVAEPQASGWDGILPLLDVAWQPLAKGLQGEGIEPPDDAHWDIPLDGRVSDQQAILVWTKLVPLVALVEGEMISGGAAIRFVKVAPDMAPADLVRELQPLLKGTA